MEDAPNLNGKGRVIFRLGPFPTSQYQQTEPLTEYPWLWWETNMSLPCPAPHINIK